MCDSGNVSQPGSPTMKLVSPTCAPERHPKHEYHKHSKSASSTHDAFLFGHMDPRRNSNDMKQAPTDTTPSDNDSTSEHDDWEGSKAPSSRKSSPATRGAAEAPPLPYNLQELATKAIARSDSARQPVEIGQDAGTYGQHHRAIVPAPLRDLPLRRDVVPPVGPLSNASLSPREPYASTDLYSPLQPNTPAIPGSQSSLASPRSITLGSPTTSHLPLATSPTNGVGWLLPSLKDLMKESPGLNSDRHTPRTGSIFPHPLPTPLPPASSITTHHSTSPISPVGSYGRDLPSPIQPQPIGSFYYPTPQTNSAGTPRPRLGGDYGSSSNAETPGSDQSGPSAADSSAHGGLSYGNNPPASEVVGTFKCTFEGCQAKPFQTQYLLNSHANVHSSARPHYCSVPGCPRSKTGKGFKRKNEMIRHGFVHESPGYACPFCPERDHRYPRPDNLQRHVRARHEDKDKNDPKLLEVLAQRPDGPSRGRRRRTVPS